MLLPRHFSLECNDNIVNDSKATLIKNDILDNKASKISFQDPIYAYWLKTEYFQNNHNIRPRFQSYSCTFFHQKSVIFHKFLYRIF